MLPGDLLKAKAALCRKVRKKCDSKGFSECRFCGAHKRLNLFPSEFKIKNLRILIKKSTILSAEIQVARENFCCR